MSTMSILKGKAEENEKIIKFVLKDVDVLPEKITASVNS